jgi:hypothetical protein
MSKEQMLNFFLNYCRPTENFVPSNQQRMINASYVWSVPTEKSSSRKWFMLLRVVTDYILSMQTIFPQFTVCARHLCMSYGDT